VQLGVSTAVEAMRSWEKKSITIGTQT